MKTFIYHLPLLHTTDVIRHFWDSYSFWHDSNSQSTVCGARSYCTIDSAHDVTSQQQQPIVMRLCVALTNPATKANHVTHWVRWFVLSSCELAYTQQTPGEPFLDYCSIVLVLTIAICLVDLPTMNIRPVSDNDLSNIASNRLYPNTAAAGIWALNRFTFWSSFTINIAIN